MTQRFGKSDEWQAQIDQKAASPSSEGP